MSENLYGNDQSQVRVLSFQHKAPSAPDGHQNPLKVVYSHTKTPSSISRGVNRHIPHAPDRILDAPDIKDDYYLNLLDWSEQNILAVALDKTLYLWDAGNGSIQQVRPIRIYILHKHHNLTVKKSGHF